MLLSAKKDIYMINFSEKKTPLHSLNLVGGGGVPRGYIYIIPFYGSQLF